MMKMMKNGETNEYMKGFTFDVPRQNVGDADKPFSGGNMGNMKKSEREARARGSCYALAPNTFSSSYAAVTSSWS